MQIKTSPRRFAKRFNGKTSKPAALAFAAVLSFGAVTPQAGASGIPTVDIASIAQTILVVMESIQQTTSLIDQYDTQLAQYEDQLRNSLAPAAYIWEQVDVTLSKMEAAQAMLNVYQNQLGGLEGYLGKFKDPNFYKNSPCYSTKGCSKEEREFLQKAQEEMQQASLEMNKAAATSSRDRVNALQKNREKLAVIKKQADAATGQLQAIGATNQFAGLQSDQLILANEQLASLVALLAQRELEANDRAARERAATERFLNTDAIKKTANPKGWTAFP